MYDRYAFTRKSTEPHEEVLNPEFPDLMPRYNIAPSQTPRPFVLQRKNLKREAGADQASARSAAYSPHYSAPASVVVSDSAPRTQSLAFPTTLGD